MEWQTSFADLADSRAMQRFVGVDTMSEQVPDVASGRCLAINQRFPRFRAGPALRPLPTAALLVLLAAPARAWVVASHPHGRAVRVAKYLAARHAL